MKEKIEKILKNKRLIFTILICLAFLTSISYAMYNIVLEGQREHTIKTSKLTFSYKEQLENLNILAYEPLTDEEGKSQKDYYEFTVKGTSDAEDVINYVIYLKEETSSKSFSSDDIKVYLTSVLNDVETVVLEPTIISELSLFKETENTKELYESSFTFTSNDLSNKEATYRLRIWLKEDFNLNDYLNKSTTDGEQNIKLDSYEYKFKVNVATTDALPPSGDEEEPNIPNAPELATNMIPVTYNGTTWVKADSTNANDAWYNYDNKVWANAVTVTSANRQTYLDATAGTPISMDDINTMWVWIPSFSATMGYVDCSTVVEQSVEKYPMCYDVSVTPDDQAKMAAFLGQMGVEDTDTVVADLVAGETVNVQGADIDLAVVVNYWNSYVVQQDPTATPMNPTYEFNSTKSGNRQSFDIKFTRTSETSHDAFTFGSETLSGFWMAKFEPSHPTLSEQTDYDLLGCTNDTCENAKAIEILPNKTPLRRNNVSNMFYAGRSLEQSENNYGLVSNEIDTHMMKNNEWGAVAYLTYSEFGRCTDDYVCTDIGINNEGTTDDWDTIKTGYGAPAGSAVGVENGAYNTALGMDASTTGNIYGVYDMSGGSFEYVMGVYTDGNKLWSGHSTDYNSGFNGCVGVDCASEKKDGLAFPDSKYHNVYTTSDAYKSSGLQHAMTETNGWYNDGVAFVSSGSPWVGRGGVFSSGGVAGVFTAGSNYGVGYENDSFRPVLVK